MDSPQDMMPWVGLYTALASFVCTLAMATDVIQGFWQWKLWFPNKFFTLNATTITLMAIAMKLPVDLTIDTYDDTEVYTRQSSNEYTKISSIIFLVTMLANFLPSLGSISDRELLTNLVALGLLVITVIVNTIIQTFTQVHLISIRAITTLIFTLLCPFSVALSVSTSRKQLEHMYKKLERLVSSNQEKKFSFKELKCNVKKYWMIAETHNPQFVIACSPVSSAFGFICPILVYTSVEMVVDMKQHWYGSSDYKWSLKIIFIVQSLGVVIGSIAPIFRSFTYIGHYNLSIKWSKKHLNVFRVEKHWIQWLQEWKHSHGLSNIPGRHSKIVFHNLKTSFLYLCIALHIMVLVICKIVCLFPRTILALLSCGLVFLEPLFKRFKKVVNTSNNNLNSEIEECVVQVKDEEKLSKRILRNMFHSITHLLDECAKKEPLNLIKLLEKSTGFNGVVEFDNDQVPPLYTEETNNCWSLVVVTLTTIVIALPNIANGRVKGLLVSMREGLQIVRHIEECLNTDVELVKARKAARCAWTEVEVYCKWLQIDLQIKERKGKTSKEILRWLGDEAAKIVIEFKSNEKSSIDHSPYKFILASSMYRISRTILFQCNEQETLSNDEELLEWISTIIADVLLACYTNIPRVIKMKCHHDVLEKKGDNIRNAAHLLGKSKRILKILKARQLPNFDLDTMKYIDKWRVLLRSELPIASSSSGCNDCLIVNIM